MRVRNESAEEYATAAYGTQSQEAWIGGAGLLLGGELLKGRSAARQAPV